MISVQLLYLNLHFTSCLFVDMQNYVYLTQENVLNPITIHQLKVPLPLLCAFARRYPFHPESWPQVAHKLARHTTVLRPFPSHSNVNFKFRAERLVWPISHIMRFKAAGRAITRILKIMIKRRMKNHKKLIHWLRGQQLYLFLFEIPFTVLYRLIHSKWRRPYRAGVMYLH